MSKVGWVAIVFAVLAMVSTAWVVLGNETARKQLYGLRFPLDGLGESTVAMVIPVALASGATVLGLLSLRHKAGRWGLGLSVAAWAVNLLVLGRSGFEYLF